VYINRYTRIYRHVDTHIVTPFRHIDTHIVTPIAVALGCRNALQVAQQGLPRHLLAAAQRDGQERRDAHHHGRQAHRHAQRRRRRRRRKGNCQPRRPGSARDPGRGGRCGGGGEAGCTHFGARLVNVPKTLESEVDA